MIKEINKCEAMEIEIRNLFPYLTYAKMQLTSRTFPSNTSNISTTATIHFIDRRPSPPHGKWESVKTFVWNRHKRTFLGRSVRDWYKLLVFYLMFLTFVIGVTIILIKIASRQIKLNCKDRPCIKKNDIISSASPGLSFEPNVIKTQSPLVLLTNKEIEKSVKYYTTYIREFLKKYDIAINSKLYGECSFGTNSTTCPYNLTHLGPCGEFSYGYENNTPCIYVKLNKFPEWTPHFYVKEKLPSYMPYNLKTTIQESRNSNLIWLHCGGVNPADVEHLGPISYYPSQGFSRDYFLHENMYKDYLTPVVAIHLNNVKRGYAISMSCSIWAKNINENKDSKDYTVQIQLYIDDI